MAKVGATTSFTDFGRWTPSWLGLATNQRMEKYLARFTRKNVENCRAAAIAPRTFRGCFVYYSRAIARRCAPPALFPAFFVPIQFEDGRWSRFLTDRCQSRRFASCGTWSSPVYLEAGTSKSPAHSRTSSVGPSHHPAAWRSRVAHAGRRNHEPDVKPFLCGTIRKTPEMIAAVKRRRWRLPEIRAGCRRKSGFRSLERSSLQAVLSRRIAKKKIYSATDLYTAGCLLLCRAV